MNLIQNSKMTLVLTQDLLEHLHLSHCYRTSELLYKCSILNIRKFVKSLT
jgi:hypothetical protein